MAEAQGGGEPCYASLQEIESCRESTLQADGDRRGPPVGHLSTVQSSHTRSNSIIDPESPVEGR